MNFFELVLKFLKLKAMEVQDWTERKLAAIQLSLKLALMTFFAPFFLAFPLHWLGASETTITGTFGGFLLVAMFLMLVVLMRAGVIAAAIYGIGKGLDTLSFRKDGHDAHGGSAPAPAAHGHDAHGHAAPADGSFTGFVYKKLLRGFAWMLYVGAFYAVVPVWNAPTYYAVSMVIMGFATFYVLGYPEDHKPEWRKALFRISVIGFMAIVMVSSGIVRHASQSGRAAWDKLPSVMLFSTAVVLGILALVLTVFSAVGQSASAKEEKGAHGHGHHGHGDAHASQGSSAALKLAGRICGVMSIAMFAIVFVFGDMSWLQFRTAYGNVKVGERTIDAIDRMTGDSSSATPDAPMPVPPSDSLGMYNEAVPGALPEPDRPSVGNDPSATDAPSAVVRDVQAPSAPSAPRRAVRKTPHQGDALDKVTDLVDESDAELAAVGL